MGAHPRARAAQAVRAPATAPALVQEDPAAGLVRAGAQPRPLRAGEVPDRFPRDPGQRERSGRAAAVPAACGGAPGRRTRQVARALL